MNGFQLAWLNLVRHKTTTVLALLCIALSVACSGLLLRFFKLSETRFSTLAHAGEAVVGAKSGGLEILLGSLNLEGPYPPFLPATLYQSLRDKRNVQFEDGQRSSPSYIRGVIPFVYFAKYKNYRVIGTDEAFVHRPAGEVSPQLKSGVWLREENDVVVGAEAARKEQLKVGDTLVLNGWTGAEPSPQSFSVQVAGILEPQASAWDNALFAPLARARQVLQRENLKGRSIWKAEVLHYFLIFLNPEGFEPLRSLINQRTVAEVISVEEETQHLEALTGTGKRIGLFLTLFILLMGSFAVMAMMVTRFDSLNVQLAVLRALGYTKGAVTGWLLCEGVLLGAGATALGAFFDFLLFPSLRASLGEALPPATLIAMPLWESAPVWVSAIAATAAAVFIPLIRLYGQDVHDSLKGV